MKKIIIRYQFVFLALIFILSVFLRFYKLDKVPDGLYQDETAIGYNAYSILTTGRDEYGKTLPLYFKSFGDRKLPVYIYLTSMSERLFGENAFAVRFPSALFGSLTVLVLFSLVKKTTKSTRLSLLSALLLALTPWHLHFSRAGFEVNVALFFALAGTVLLLHAKDKSKWQILFLITSIVSYGLSLYSYNVTRLLSPLLALSVIFFYRKDFVKLSKYKIAVAIGTGLVVLLPFLVTLFTRAGASSAGGALITSADVQAKTLEFRSYFIEHSFISKLLLNKWVMMVWVYLENIGGILSGNFFFVQGSTHGNQGIGTAGGFYLFELPLFLSGLVAIILGKSKKISLFLFWGAISFLVLALSKEVPHATRGYFLVIPITVIAAGGIIYAVEILRAANKYLRYLLYFTFSLFIMFNVFYYFSSYYIRFPVFYAKEWRQQDREVVNYILQNDSKYDRIIFDAKTDFIYTSYLFYSKYPPQDFYSTVKRSPDDTEGFSKVQSFGKLEFKEVDWSKDYKQSRTLIVTTTDNKPKEVPPLKSFYFPTRPVVVSLKEQLFEYPVSDIPYVLVEGRM